MNQYSVKEMEERIIQVASEIAKEFNLPLKSIEFIRSENTYGQCSRDGCLKFKIQWPDGELVPVMEVWRTVAHELAHLTHFNHDEGFWVLNKRYVEWISRRLGIKIRPEIAIMKRGLGDYKVIK